jgi:hypothetical protein
MPRVGFEPTIPLFERAKTFYVLGAPSPWVAILLLKSKIEISDNSSSYWRIEQRLENRVIVTYGRDERGSRILVVKPEIEILCGPRIRQLILDKWAVLGGGGVQSHWYQIPPLHMTLRTFYPLLILKTCFTKICLNITITSCPRLFKWNYL